MLNSHQKLGMLYFINSSLKSSRLVSKEEASVPEIELEIALTVMRDNIMLGVDISNEETMVLHRMFSEFYGTNSQRTILLGNIMEEINPPNKLISSIILTIINSENKNDKEKGKVLSSLNQVKDLKLNEQEEQMVLMKVLDLIQNALTEKEFMRVYSAVSNLDVPINISVSRINRNPLS